MGFSLENIIDDMTPYKAPDNAFVNAVSGMVQSFPWERFERFFESKPLVDASALDQVFLLRILAIQEILCLDDDGVLKWLKSQMYLFAFLSPGYKPKVPTRALLINFREKLQDANLLEPFRLRCQSVILKKNGRPTTSQKTETTSYMEAFAPSPFELFNSGLVREGSLDAQNTLLDIHVEDKWVICPECKGSALQEVESGLMSHVPQASCNHCGHQFKV